MRTATTTVLVVVALWLILAFFTRTVFPPDQATRALNWAVREAVDVKLTNAELDSAGNCVETPDQLAAEASETLGAPVTVEEYTLARMCATESLSDLKGGSDDDKNARIWVAINDANENNGGDIVQCVTGGNGFGKQGSLRKYATGRSDPTDYHLALVRQCMGGVTPDPTGGATHFLDKYGFVTPGTHTYDPAVYAAAVQQWTNYGWRKVLTIGRGLEIWHV